MEELNQRITALEELVESLRSSTTMPLDFAEAMRNRLVKPTGKLPSSITITLTSTPGGTIVPKPPDGFIRLQDGKNIPFYYN